MKLCSLLIICLGLAGCAVSPPEKVSRNFSDLVEKTGMQSFPNTATARAVNRSNVDIAKEFLELTFQLESGQAIPHFTRFEEPVSIGINPGAARHVIKDLDRLIARLRAEVGLNVHRVSGNKASIYVEIISKKQLHSVIPTAACFVVPNVTGWAEYKKMRFRKTTDWTRLKKRERLTVFMPSDVSPQDSRDCLHEEIAQAMGPVNDLYRLSDSVYNDDNFNIVLTAYDMLILKVFYAPELKNGMTRSEVAAILPRVLARLNPIGQAISPEKRQVTSKNWIKAIETALGPRTRDATRRSAASRAVALAHEHGYKDHRLGFSYFARAQVSLRHDPGQAAADFARAYNLFKSLFGLSSIHTASAAVQMASLSFSAGKYEAALHFINTSIPAARASQNGSLLFSFLAMKAEIYKVLGRTHEAKMLKREAISWGHYGVASDVEISERLDQIAALRPEVLTKGF